MAITNLIHFKNLRGDLFAGLTTAIISLPLSLSFGVASGAGPAAGLYGAVCVGLFAALFGGTPTLISEPTGPMTVVMTTVIANLTASNPEQGLTLAFTVVMLGGLFQILFGVLRLGKYVTLMPYSVISGFMTGIGIILILLQIGPFLGHANVPGGVVGALRHLPEFIRTIQPSETALGCLSVALLFLMPKPWRRYLPPQLVALLVGTLIAETLLSGLEIRRIGEIPMGLPSLHWPVVQPQLFNQMVVNGAVLGILGCIDSLLTSVIADNLTRTRHNSDKEVIGQGIGNVVSGLLGGLPGAGATMGTVVNIQTGGQTALAGICRSLILCVVILWAAPLIEIVPVAVLAGITLKVGIDILDWSFLKRAHRISFKGTAIMYGVMFLTVFVDLIAAVGVGVFIANLLTLQRLSELRAKDVKAVTDADDAIDLSPEEADLLSQGNNQILLFYLSGPMIFAISQAIAREQTRVDQCRVLIMDLSDVPHLGVSSSLAIENAILDALDKGRQVYVAGAIGKTRQRLESLNIFDRLPRDHMVLTRGEALREALNWLQSHHPQPDTILNG
ncbi:MAG: SulP family inorganic anion transporter [Synechococcaceae cyanobacterium SM2_3_1]|nr:SulP family inorganic anion transporter [Synechococcaceae cyanobacterium SM2_3_1]